MMRWSMRRWSMLRGVSLATLLPAILTGQSLPTMDVAFDATPPAAIALRAPSGTVALAMGNVGMVSTDADVLFYNPGMLTAARGMAMSAQRYQGNGTAASMAATQMFGSTGVAIGARFADWSSVASVYGDAVRDGLGLLGGAGSGRASSTALTAGAARVVGPVRVGIGATYVRESFRADHDESSQFDVGVVLPVGFTSLALSVQHIGNPLGMSGLNPASFSGDFPDASRWRTTLGYGGWGLPLATFWDLGGTVQVSVDESGTVRSAGGAELTYVPVEGVAIAGRIGSRSTTGNELPITGGFGVSLDRYSLDYAIESFREGVRAHRVGVRIR